MTQQAIVYQVQIDAAHQDMQQWHDLIYACSGLKIDENRYQSIRQSMPDLYAATQCASEAELMMHLRVRPTDDPVWQMILNKVTIGETYFFRNAPQFRALRTEILPQIIRKRRESGFLHLDIWSAGCATGEEPYSIAILLTELLPDIHNWSIHILATDINTHYLEIARRGVYRAHSFRLETRPDIQARYLTQNASGFELPREIREMVSFMPLNLVTDDYPSFNTRTINKDLVVCRNVTIYFNEATTRQVVKRFYHALQEGGWLIVGHAEPASGVYDDFATRNFQDTVVYQKAPRANLAVVQPACQPKGKRIKQQRSEKGVSLVARLAARSDQNEAHQVAISEIPATRQKRKEAEVTEPEKPTISQVRLSLNEENWIAAQVFLDQLEQSTPMDPHVHYLRGLLLMQSGEMNQAQSALRRSVYCDPSFALAYYTLGEVHLNQDKVKDAVRCWRISLRAIKDLDDNAFISEEDALTVEMFRELVNMRLDSL